jgi:hypothetical protein
MAGGGAFRKTSDVSLSLRQDKLVLVVAVLRTAPMNEPPVEVSADDINPRPRHTGHAWLDMALALSAIFISAVSLFVAIEHGKTERDLVAANSWPFLREILSNGFDAQGSVAIGFSNGGVGPAKVHSFEVAYRGTPASSSLDLLRLCCGLPTGGADAVRTRLPNGFNYSTADETVIRPAEGNAVLIVRRSPQAPDVPDRFAAALKDITFRACYCSVLDECWQSDLRSTRTRPVKACPAPAHPFDPNGP